MILDALTDLFERRSVASALPGAGEARTLAPLPGGSAAAFAALLSDRVPLLVCVTPRPGDAETLAADLDTLEPDVARAYFPQREVLPHEDTDPHVEIAAQRVRALAETLSGATRLLVTTERALVERAALPAGPEGLELSVEVGDRVRLDHLTDRLEAMGFRRRHTVEELGELAVRGGILDVFPFGHEAPVRIELWGDEIASLRRFDLVSQRSTGSAEEVRILPVDLQAASREDVERRALLEILPAGSLLLHLDRAAGARQRDRLWSETEEARDRGGSLSTAELLVPPEEAEERLSAARRLAITAEEAQARDRDGDGVGDAPTGDTTDAPDLDLGIAPPPAIERDMSRLVDEISTAVDRGDRVLLLSDNRGQMERLEEIVTERAGAGLAGRVSFGLGELSGGFRVPGSPDGTPSLLVLTDHQIFQRSHRIRRGYRTRGAPTLESVASLEDGDYVVHLDHGVGRFRGLERVEVGGEAIETLRIEYADGEFLRVPHYRLDLIEKWSSTDLEEGENGAGPARVHKLGGKRWRSLKQRTVASIQETAAELLELYAHRQVADGHAFDGIERWQREFESAFLYEETPDQLAAWEEVRADMEAPRPMDRLICGDVGYGKTEVAMRAAFKAVLDGKQVAVLAPTTVLVEQHLHTFGERMAGFPVRIGAMSRFQSGSEQDEALEALADGTMDIVIGTHRLLSGDVGFSDLGLLVVDEEQRFGVRQKERLKDLKRSVDVLSLTATPIPRTLQLALGGLRDLSTIETPPRDRMPIITHVLRWSDMVLRDAMRRELDRGGQVFFVHDRVKTIGALAGRVRKLMPEASVAVAHGRMPERKLEQAMTALMEGDVDILVSTSIIENGLDVPTANTMIVHRADMFGLSQLYQLRGRVGRSHHRAYCYLLVPPDVTPEAERRLRILEHHTELGSGYEVALKDLELRGAGNLLGEEQSGFAQAVGFETYRRLLEKTVARLKGEEETDAEPPRVSISGEAYLPDDYILDDEQKMHLYRRISRLEEPEEVEDLRDELRDRFGPPPKPAEKLLAAMELKLLGTPLGVEWIRVGEGSARVNFREEAVPRLALLRNAFHDRQVDVEVRRAQPLSLVLEQAGVEPLLPTLVDALEVLARTEEAGSRATVGP